jgi:hypothetical protein
VGGGVQLGPLGIAATNRPIVPGPNDYDDREICWIIGRGNRSTRINPAPVPLCPTQNPNAARTRTRAAAVGSQRLTARDTAWPLQTTNLYKIRTHWLALRPSSFRQGSVHRFLIKSCVLHGCSVPDIVPFISAENFVEKLWKENVPQLKLWTRYTEDATGKNYYNKRRFVHI